MSQQTPPPMRTHSPTAPPTVTESVAGSPRDQTAQPRPISRRRFQGLLGIAALGVVQQSGCLSARDEDSTTPRRELFDIHTHLGQPWFDSKPVTVSELLRWMDEHGIERAVVLPLVSPEAFYYPVTTEFVLRETKPHRDRLVPFCAIDPRTAGTHLTKHEELVGMLRRYVDAGAKGFGEHKPRLPIDDPLNEKLYAACAEVELPILFHLDNQANMDKPGLPGLKRMLEQFPRLPFIGHGKGWWASIAGGLTQADLHVGYPSGPVSPGGAIDALMDLHSNLYGDLSSSGAHALTRDVGFGRKFLVRQAARLLFGTDYYAVGQSFPHFRLLDELGAATHVRDLVQSQNAKRLLGL